MPPTERVTKINAPLYATNSSGLTWLLQADQHTSFPINSQWVNSYYLSWLQIVDSSTSFNYLSTELSPIADCRQVENRKHILHLYIFRTCVSSVSVYYHSSHSNPHYIKLIAGFLDYSEFIVLYLYYIIWLSKIRSCNSSSLLQWC